LLLGREPATFAIPDGAVKNVLEEISCQKSRQQLKPSLGKLAQRIYKALTQSNLGITIEKPEVKARILRTITAIDFKPYQKDIQRIWDEFADSQEKDINTLIANLDQYFTDKELGEDMSNDLEENDHPDKDDFKLVCYQWFNSAQ